MIIVYHCYGGAHSSVISAAIHSGAISDKKKPGFREIKGLPLFDKNTSENIGRIYYYGNDKKGNKIYIQGMGHSVKIIKQLIDDFRNIFDVEKNNLILVDTLKNVNIIVRIGGFLSRRLGLIFPGRFLTIIGIKLSYFKYVKTVNDIKAKIAE